MCYSCASGLPAGYQWEPRGSVLFLSIVFGFWICVRILTVLGALDAGHKWWDRTEHGWKKALMLHCLESHRFLLQLFCSPTGVTLILSGECPTHPRVGVNFPPQAVCQGFPLSSSITHTRGHLGGPFAGPLAPAFALSCPFLRHKLEFSISCDRSHVCSRVLWHSTGCGSMWGQHAGDLFEMGRYCVCRGWQCDPGSPFRPPSQSSALGTWKDQWGDKPYEKSFPRSFAPVPFSGSERLNWPVDMSTGAQKKSG